MTPEHDWRLWRMGGAIHAGSAAPLVPPADVQQRRRMACRRAGPLPGTCCWVRTAPRRRYRWCSTNWSSTGCRSSTFNGNSLRTADGGARAQARGGHGQAARHRRAA